MWVPLERGHEALQRLSQIFLASGLRATGTMCIEVYAARGNPFWLSPGYQRDSLRIDPFFFWRDGNSREEAIRDFFPHYWEALREFDFRFHWAKALSGPSSSTGVPYRRQNLPRFDDFL